MVLQMYNNCLHMVKMMTNFNKEVTSINFSNILQSVSNRIHCNEYFPLGAEAFDHFRIQDISIQKFKIIFNRAS